MQADSGVLHFRRFLKISLFPIVHKQDIFQSDNVLPDIVFESIDLDPRIRVLVDVDVDNVSVWVSLEICDCNSDSARICGHEHQEVVIGKIPVCHRVVFFVETKLLNWVGHYDSLTFKSWDLHVDFVVGGGWSLDDVQGGEEISASIF